MDIELLQRVLENVNDKNLVSMWVDVYDANHDNDAKPSHCEMFAWDDVLEELEVDFPTELNAEIWKHVKESINHAMSTQDWKVCANVTRDGNGLIFS